MTDDDLLPEAVAELYASGPDEFIKRRGELADRARVAGQAALAKRIAGLRKPTRSAWIVNQLIRADPAVNAQLAQLGQQLRAAQSSLDGAALRDLSLQRRRLIDTLARQAFTVAGQPSPPAAMRDEVTATLGAALADPQVAERVRAGTLERAAHSEGFGGEGFGTGGAQVLTLVPPSSGGGLASGSKTAAPVRNGATAASAWGGTAANWAHSRRAASGARPTGARPTGARPTDARPTGARPTDVGQRAAVAPGRRPAETTELAAVRARAERERRRHAISEAERELAEADWALDVGAQAEREQERAVQLLEEELADARHLLAAVRLEARQAAATQRHARQALDRLRK